MDKLPDAFRTISEVAEELELPQHVLRFWETRFAQVRPMKRAGGRRHYRPEDVDLLRGLRHLLYGEGYTVKGVQQILKEEGVGYVMACWRDGAPQSSNVAALGLRDSKDEVALAAFACDMAEPDEEREVSPPVATAPDPASPEPGVATARPLSRDSIRRLEAALHELSECKLLLERETEKSYREGDT